MRVRVKRVWATVKRVWAMAEEDMEGDDHVSRNNMSCRDEKEMATWQDEMRCDDERSASADAMMNVR
jgi:hypothetical protein